MASRDNGPDQIVESQNICTTDPNGSVLLKIPKTGKAIETSDPISVPGLLTRTAKQFPNTPALAVKDPNGKWQTITYKEYLEQVRICAKGFLQLGLERYHAVCILGFNSPEWFISDIAAIFAGGFAAGIYTTNSPEACQHCAACSRANIIVVEDEKQLDKILTVKDSLPDLKAIVQYSGESSTPGVYSWLELMEIGSQQSDEKLEEVLKNIAINECCTLVYTSGTVGNPKAVMLSHDNITWDAMAVAERLQLTKGTEHIISYLPLSHVAAQVTDVYTTMVVAATVYFADKNALKGSLLTTLQEVQPTQFLAVPRVWEKMYEKMMQIGAQSGTLKKAIANWAKRHGLQHNVNKMNGNDNNVTWSYWLARNLIFKRIRQALGLGRCLNCISGAAPLSPEIKKYFLSIDIPLFEAFGMSEASGAHTISVETAFNLNSIGPAVSGVKTKIHEPDDNGNGEICMYGRHVFMGYLGQPEKTAESIDADGWLHSGDLGHVDKRGFIYITGRLKELLITAGGENVAPVPIEQIVKTELPNISNCILIGDKKKFLSLLVTLQTDVDAETGTPLDTLSPSVKKWLSDLGCPADTVTELLKAGPDDRLIAAINEGMDRVNQQATSNAQRIQKVKILPVDFSVPTGELGPTMKLKRNVVASKYSKVVEEIYS